MPIPASLREGLWAALRYRQLATAPGGPAANGAGCSTACAGQESSPLLQGWGRGWHRVPGVTKSQTPSFKANSIWKLQLFGEGTELEPGVGVCICTHRSCSYQSANVENTTIPHFLLRTMPRSRLFLLEFCMFSLTQRSSQEKD